MIGLEARVPSSICKTRIRSIPIAVPAKIAIAYMVVDPPPMKVVCAGCVVVRRNSAVAILEGCFSVVTAGAMQGDGPIVALLFYGSEAPCNASRALWIKATSALTRKEATCDKEVQRVAVGGAPDAPDDHRLHVVMVIRTSGVAGFQRVVDIAA